MSLLILFQHKDGCIIGSDLLFQEIENPENFGVIEKICFSPDNRYAIAKVGKGATIEAFSDMEHTNFYDLTHFGSLRNFYGSYMAVDINEGRGYDSNSNSGLIGFLLNKIGWSYQPKLKPVKDYQVLIQAKTDRSFGKFYEEILAAYKTDKSYENLAGFMHNFILSQESREDIIGGSVVYIIHGGTVKEHARVLPNI